MSTSSEWKEYSLEDLLIGIQPGFARRPTSNDGNVPHLRTNNITPEGKLDLSELKYVSASMKEIAKYSLLKGDVLFNNTNSDVWVGKTTHIGRDLDVLYSNHLTRLRVNNSKITPQFLAIYLQELQRDGFFKMIATRWVNQAAVNTKALCKLVLKVPPLDYQRKFVLIVDRADRLRQRREEADQLTNNIQQSVFLKLFGDPVSNPKNWPRKKLNDVCCKITDGTHITPKYVSTGIPFLSVKDIRDSYLDFSDTRFVSEEQHRELTKRSKPEPGDVLYTKVGTVGIAALVETEREFSIFVSVALIKPNHRLIDSIFLTTMLNSTFVKSQAYRRVKGIGVPDLHLVEIRDFDIIVPPMETQKEFSTILVQIDKLRAHQEEARDEIVKLLSSLIDKGFTGRLSSKEATKVPEENYNTRKPNPKPIPDNLSSQSRETDNGLNQGQGAL
jgi:type I restriction enzyme S subunit